MTMRSPKLMKMLFLALPVLVLAAVPVAAQVYNLCAGQANMTMQDGQSVVVWGFGLDTGGVCQPTVPGPVLTVPPADPVLTINLRNTLPESVSLNILGQALSNNTGPVWTDGVTETVVATGARPAGNFTARIRSFTHETAPGTIGSYTWNNFKHGSWIVQSATDPTKQVDMGLYAPVKKDFAAGNVPYEGVAAYDRELVLVFHDIDPATHAAIAAGNYGPGRAYTSSVYREAKYFLINGKSHPNPALDPLINTAQGQRVLIRFLNPGINTHVPQLLGQYMTVIAEDGFKARFPKEQVTLEMPPAKTVDAILEPTADGRFPLYDARLDLTNAGAGPGGMMAYLFVGDPTATTAILTANPPGSQGGGAIATFTGAAEPGGVSNYLYKFWLRQSVGGVWGPWQIVQDYSADNTWEWMTPNAVASYEVSLHVKKVGSVVASYEANAKIPYKVTGGAATGVTLKGVPTASVPATVPATFTATASGGSGNYQFRFWRRPTGGVWQMVQDYSSANTYVWTPTTGEVGSHEVSVHARSVGSTANYEANTKIPYSVTSAAVSTVTLNKIEGPATTVYTGETVTFKAVAIGGTGAYEYRFYLRGPSTGNVWVLQQGYSTSQTWQWTTPSDPAMAGAYQVSVHARSLGSTAYYDMNATNDYIVASSAATGVTLLGLPSSPPGNIFVNNNVTLAATGQGGSGIYEYRYWLKGPTTGGVWQVIREWSPVTALLWTAPPVTGLYSISVHVRHVGSTVDTYEARHTLNYQVNP